MAYTKQTWATGSGGGTPISATRLNYIETGLEQGHQIADSKAIVATSGSPSTLAFGQSAVLGVLTTAARADHEHAMPTPAGTYLALTGGTLSGALAMGTNKITGLGTPTATTDAATKAYADLMLPLTGGTLSGALAMGTNKITGLGAPTATTDAATKAYADSVAALRLALTGGTMSGAIAMGSNKITGLAAGTVNGDALRYEQLVGQYLPLSGGALTGALAMGNNKITGLGTPTVTTDAATKAYADLMLPLTGGTLSGNIAMGNNKVTGLGAPSATTDATTKTYVDSGDALKLSLTGGTLSGALAMGNNKITGLGEPTAVTDAATRGFVEKISASTKTANYTLVLGDAGTCIEMNSTSARTITIPPNSTVAFPVGTVIEFCNINTGTLTIVQGAGVTVNTPATLALDGQYATAVIRKRATDTWVLDGRLV